jgi:hypothetical protein
MSGPFNFYQFLSLSKLIKARLITISFISKAAHRRGDYPCLFHLSTKLRFQLDPS